MTQLFSDTRPEAEAVLIELLRQQPAWQKLQRMNQLNTRLRTLAMSGLRHATQMQVRQNFAAAWPICYSDQNWQHRSMAHCLKPSLNSMNDEATEVTLRVTSVLEDLGVPHLIGGSLASTVHGELRGTLGSDLVADLLPQHVPLLAMRLHDEFYVPMEAMFAAIQYRSSFNLIHLATAFKVDIFIPKQRPLERFQFANRTLQTIATDPERTAYVASAEDTILAKLEWFRLGGEVSDRQGRDVVGVIKVQGDRLDLVYLRQRAAELAVADLLEKALIVGASL